MASAWSLALTFGVLTSVANAAEYSVRLEAPQAGSEQTAILPSYLSYSIEFSSWPDFAGNLSAPNTFSNNLLNNLGQYQGSKPHIRVGGNTQDFALYDPNLKFAINGTFTPASADYPTIVFIGKSYFESYKTFDNTQFLHGFNMGGNTTQAHNTLVQTAALACKALEGGKLLDWELGNEPDLFSAPGLANKRPSNYSEVDYANEWVQKTGHIKKAVTKACPDEPYGYLAPSFAGIHNFLNDTKTWDAGLDRDKTINLISQHNYISGAESPGVTLAHTLLNHTMTVASLSQFLPSMQKLTAQYKIPYIMGETNSLYHQGKPGLSNSFGAALWGLDYVLTGAALGFKRFHMHQGTNYRYQSWQPVDTSLDPKGTKSPYYGNLAVTAALGDLSGNDVSVQTVLAQEKQVAHAIYKGSALRSLALINMNQYNYTVENKESKTQRRENTTFTLQYSGWKEGQQLKIQRLLANGSDAITGVTFDGFSYNYELDNGKPVKLNNVTSGETVTVKGGKVSVPVLDSSAAVLVS